MTKQKPSTTRVMTTSGWLDGVPVDLSDGALGITKYIVATAWRFEPSSDDLWVITHLPTGHKATAPLPLRKARKVYRRIHKAHDWSKVTLKNSKRVPAAIRNICKATWEGKA
jgi:hypothetical protein